MAENEAAGPADQGDAATRQAGGGSHADDGQPATVGSGTSQSDVGNQRDVVPVAFKTEAAQDPLTALVKIATNGDLSPGDKGTLIEFARIRFRHRRRMAYLALGTVIGSLLLAFLAAFLDGICPPETKFVESLEGIWPLIVWTDGFLATVVAAYYGISAWRPSS